MTVSLIVTTYNSPKYLALTLKSVMLQERLPDEVIVADDGSGDETRELIERLKKEYPVPLIHVWQPDDGFRLCAIRNKAIEKATGDYIVQIDGDIIMHPKFISDHARSAKRGYFVAGIRTFITEEYSNRILKIENIDYKEIAKNCEHLTNAYRVPMLTPLFKYRRLRNKTTIRGCNMAYWRDDALKINGYNEDFIGWGCEDCEFSIRLSNMGLKKLWLKFSAVAFHVYHVENSRENKSVNRKIMLKALKEGVTYVPNGIIKG